MMRYVKATGGKYIVPILLTAFILLLISGLQSALGALGNVSSMSRNGDTLTLGISSDTLIVQVCRTNLIKVDYLPGGASSSDTLVIGVTNWSAVGATINTNSNPIVITTSQMRVEIGKTPCRISLFDAAGNLLIKEQSSEGVFSDGVRFNFKSGSDLYGVTGFNVWDDSSGGMLRNSGGWVEAGYQGDCGAPFIWSRAGFGVLIDSDGVQFDVSGTNLVAQYVSKTDIEYYLAAGRPADIVSAVMEVSGTSPMFPKWSIGFNNTEWGITQSELTNSINGYRSRQIPLDHYIVDFDWKAWGEDNYGEWRWNTGNFPGGPSGALKAQLDAQGVHLSGIMKPRIHVDTTQGSYATAQGYWWPNSSAYQDYFDQLMVNDLNFAIANCRAWFWDHITNAFATGIQGWWNDEADQKGGGGGVFDNWEFMNMEKALYDGQRAYSTQRVWSINRSFFLGAQRYAYAMWSGDIETGFGSMAAQRERMLSAVNLGAVRWGMDIGGFGGDPSSENYARWIQFGVFAPVFRVHGPQNSQRQPWVYGSTAEAVAKAAIQLRYKLIPYIYSYERRTAVTGVGITRPLFYDYPSDANVANYKDAWMFGDYLLAAPVVDQAQSSKSIYLPAGTWYDYFRGTVYNGGQTISYSVNSTTWTDIPVFVKKGAIIPTQPVMNYVSERPVTNIYVDVFPDSAQTSFQYYDDDGVSYGYESSNYFQQIMTAQKNAEDITFSLTAASGAYTPDLQYYCCRIYCETTSVASINGSVPTHYDNLAALEGAVGEGWAEATNQFGYAVLVKVAAGLAKTVAVSNNLVATPTFDPAPGAFAESVLVTITNLTQGVTIRYTLDGSDPAESSAEYVDPLLISVSTTIKARAYKAGKDPSAIASATYTLDNNLLHNPGFEVPGVASNRAFYWYSGDPDGHGDMLGNALRVNWQGHSGSWQGTVRGTWANLGNYGSFWQEVPAIVGRKYVFSAWLWADNTWSPGTQGIKLEFWRGETVGTNLISAVTNRFTGIGQSWTNKSVTATAPAGSEWVRVVVFATNVSAEGALQFDDLRLEPTNVWTLLVQSQCGAPNPSVGPHVFDNARVLTNTVDSPVTIGATQYVCSGWTMTGNNPMSGTNNHVVMIITNDATLSWNWTTNYLNPCTLAFDASGYSVGEAAGAAVVTVVRGGSSNGQVSVNFSTGAGTAEPGSDYWPTNGTLVLADGVLSNTFTVAISDDLENEPDETINLALSSPSGGATLAEPDSAVLTILDDDPDLGQRTLTVMTAHGLADPTAGVHTNSYGVNLACRITDPAAGGGTQYVCQGWSGTGSVPAVGSTTSTPSFTLTNDSGIVWLWATNLQFSRAAGPNGSVGGDSSGWYPLGASVIVTATPVADYHFAGWSGAVAPAQTNDNPLTLVMDQIRSVTANFAIDTGANLLRNPGFEQQGSNEEKALYWNLSNPDRLGEMWGTAARVSWRTYSGSWEGTIRGTWIGLGTEGGFWQDVSAIPGQQYHFTAWFWADDGNPDGPWTAGEQAMKIEFLNSQTQLVSAATNAISGVNQTWQSRTMNAVAPDNAAWARVVILARNVGGSGALQFDDLRLEMIPILAAPAVLPADPTNATSFTANWGDVPEATGYLLDVATNSSFDPGIHASDLIISEYGEGDGNNRYVEIYNGTGSARDMTQYRLWGISAGGNWYESSIALSNTLANGDAYVICNNACTSAIIKAQADHIAANSAPMNFSGDDAVGLARVTGSLTNLIDAVGTTGPDPGTGWGVGGTADATFNHTLVRKSSVTVGNSTWSSCSNEWTVYPINTFGNLGAHSMTSKPPDFVSGYLARSLGDINSSVVTGLAPKCAYYYRVRATNENGVSIYSATSPVTTRAMTYTIHASAGANGSIQPAGDIEVEQNSSTSFVVTAAVYFHIEDLKTNDVSLSGVSGLHAYTSAWISVNAAGTLAATFDADTATNRATPHWWLAMYGLTNATIGFNEAEIEDRDADGLDAWQEFIVLSDPTNRQSSFIISGAPALDAAEHIIRWQGVSDRYYSIYYSTNLATAPGVLVQNLFGANCYTDTVNTGVESIYYRIKARLVPEP